MLLFITLLACLPELPQATDCADSGSCPQATCPDAAPGDPPPSWYLDADGDGVGAGDPISHDCEAPVGAVSTTGDCDDQRSSVFPGAEEVCDGLDNDCDGQLDRQATDATLWYVDSDGDGFGASEGALRLCEPTEDLVDNDGDCDDQDPQVSPAALEMCDGVDNDCDGLTDDDDPDSEGFPWYADGDGDSYGLDDQVAWACEAPHGYAEQLGDCDDEDSSINPGAEEICNGIDDDCSGWAERGDVCDARCETRSRDANGERTAYLACDIIYTHYEAMRTCENWGWQLASLATHLENDWVHANVLSRVSTPAWIGLSRDSTGAWTWEDGSPYADTAWHSREGKEDDTRNLYAAIGASQGRPSPNDTWTAERGTQDETQGFVCETYPSN